MNPPAYMRPWSEHLFGLTVYGPNVLVPYCTCGLIFKAKLNPSLNAKQIRRDWVDHVKKVITRTETRDPLSNI